MIMAGVNKVIMKQMYEDGGAQCQALINGLE